MAKTENKNPAAQKKVTKKVAKKVAKKSLGQPELRFGGWQYAPAPEGTDHVAIEDRYGLFINGEFVRPKSGKYFATINPATEKKISEVAQANGKDVDLSLIHI